MEIIETHIKDLLLIKPKVFGDSRGYFFESYNEQTLSFLENGEKFVQDNQSLSHKNVVRGLHMQLAPHTQGKFVRAITGAVLDVVVDARKDSPTFGKHFSVELNADNKLMMYVPKGFLHGFTTLEDNTIFTYKCTSFYDKASEITVMWNDTDLNIDWRCANPIISDKDVIGFSFKTFAEQYAR
jgi:dTDP-4-dehydrorhamnose 3,5-epimerase